MRVQRLDTKTGYYIDMVADLSSIRLETDGGLVVGVTDRPAENRIELKVDHHAGRLDVQELTATDSQVRVKVAGVLAPAGATLAGVTQRLLEIEWVIRQRDDGTTYGQCPACGRLRDERHTYGCWLGAFLGQPTSFNPAKPGEQA